MNGVEREGAVAEIETSVRSALWEWENSDELPSDGAQRIVAIILRHERLQEAMTKLGCS